MSVTKGQGLLCLSYRENGHRQEKVNVYAGHPLSKSQRHTIISLIRSFWYVRTKLYFKSLLTVLIGEKFIYIMIMALCCGYITSNNQKTSWSDGWRNQKNFSLKWFIVRVKPTGYIVTYVQIVQSSNVNVMRPDTITPIVLATVLGGKSHQNIRNCQMEYELLGLILWEMVD